MTQLLILFIVGFVLTLIFKSYAKFEKENPYSKQHLKIQPTYKNIAESELGLFIALSAKVAKADGVVHELEAELVSNLLDDVSKVFKDSSQTRDMLKKIFNEHKKYDNTKDIVDKLNKILGNQNDKKLQMLAFLFNLAFIDGEFSKKEQETIEFISYHLHVSKEDYENIKAKFESSFSNVRNESTIDEAYKTLNATKDDSLDVIKKKYRKLVKEYHPDIVKAQGKDESYIQEATQKVQVINAAYELIKKERR